MTAELVDELAWRYEYCDPEIVRNIEYFMDDVKQDCFDMGVTICNFPAPVTFTSQYDTDSVSLGFIDPNDHILAVAKYSANSMSVLVHEYAHLQQWMEGDPTWTAFNKVKFDWNVPYEKLSKRNLKVSTELTRDNELDCERRALQLIKDYELAISHSDYVKGGNANVLLYNAIQRMRRPNVKTVSLNKKLMACMPADFDTIDYTDIHSWHVDQVIKHAF